MPPLSTRIFKESARLPVETGRPMSPFDGNDSALSPWGNSAPNRGLLPPDFMYDFQTRNFYPDAFTFVRGTVDVSTPLRNTALQALSAAGIKIL